MMQMEVHGLLILKEQFLKTENLIFICTQQIPSSKIRSGGDFVTADYYLVKCLVYLLSPLTQSDQSIKDTQQFAKQLHANKKQDGYTINSYDIKSIITGISLDKSDKINV